MTDKFLQMLVCIKGNSLLWSQRFRGLSRHLFVFITCLCCTHRLGPTRFREKSSVSHTSDRLARNFTPRGQQCVIGLSNYTYFSNNPPPPEKGAPLTVCIMAWQVCTQKFLCGERFTNRPIVVSNCHTYAGHNLIKYPRQWQSPDQQLGICKCGKQLVWTFCNINVVINCNHHGVSWKVGFSGFSGNIIWKGATCIF